MVKKTKRKVKPLKFLSVKIELETAKQLKKFLASKSNLDVFGSPILKSTTEAVTFAVQEFLKSRGYLGPPPEKA